MDDDGRLVEAIARAMKPDAFAGYGHAGPQRDYWEFQRSKARELARAALSAIEREGWKVVRVEPTEEMLAAAGVMGQCDPRGFLDSYAKALSAAPKQG